MGLAKHPAEERCLLRHISDPSILQMTLTAYCPISGHFHLFNASMAILSWRRTDTLFGFVRIHSVGYLRL